MLDKTKRYLVVGLGLLGGKYALELTRSGFHVDGINRSEGHLQYALEHGYIASGKTHDFEDLVRQADHIIFGLYPTALLDWFRTYGHLLKPGCIFTDVSGVKTGLVEPVQALCAFGGVLFFYTHGHHYGVKSGVYQIMEAGEERLADVVLYGHTHRQQIDEGGEGCPTAFNPGSLGFGGQYGVIECRDGEFTIQECRVPAAERG